MRERGRGREEDLLRGQLVLHGVVVVLEVRYPRLTKKLVRQQPEKRDDIGLFYHLGILVLPPKHHVHWYRAARVVR